MKKITKVCIATTIAFSTLLGASVTGALVQQPTVHAATSSYYNYDGYAGQNASFVLDKHFKNAIKAENVKFNGIKIKSTTSNKSVLKYDHYFRNVSKDGKTASLLDMEVKGQLSLTQLKKVYSKELQKIDNGNNNTTVIYYYQPKQNGMTVWFDVNKGKVDRVVLGYSTVQQAMN